MRANVTGWYFLDTSDENYHVKDGPELPGYLEPVNFPYPA